jgi:hypothetical protein
MTIRHIAAAACLLFATPSIAIAQSQPADGSSLSLSVIEQRLAADGFRVIEIERYPNSVEVKGYERAGLCVELHLDPRTGAVLRRERDDDCDRSDSSDDYHHHRRGGH